MPLELIGTDVLEQPAGADRLMDALQRNQRWWLLRVGAASGETVQRRRGVIWFDAPGATTALYVPFPRFNPATVRDELDAFMAGLRRKATLRPVWLWAADPPQPVELTLLLMARGFRHGFQPHWMWLDLATLRDDAIPRREIRIELNPDPNIWDPAKNADYLAEGRLAHMNPDRAVQAVAWADSRPVGVSCAFLTRGSSGIAGIYDVSVLPEYRNQGIGKALTHAVCVWARDRGYRIAGLNATPMGEPVYRALGFQSLRRSETWHCPVEAQRQPIVPEQIALVEAVGTGDLPALEENTGAFAPFVNAMLPCRRTPLQIAALFAQPQTANWLISHGANPDVLAYWGLGWKDETRALLTSRPELVNRRTGDWGQTPLHEAAMRGDVTLMQLLIEAGADLDARDETFHGRPLEWSKHFGQIESERLLEAVMR